MATIATPDINTLKQQRDAYLSAAAKLDAAIRELEGNPDKPVDWKNSALDCIIAHNFPLRTVDILNCMAIKDPDKFKVAEFIKRRNYVSALSIALNNLCDNKVLDRLQVPGFKGYFYGMKDWFSPLHTLNNEIESRLKHQLFLNPTGLFSLSKLEADLEDD